MDREVLYKHTHTHSHTGILISHKEEILLFVTSWMSGRERQILYELTHM